MDRQGAEAGYLRTRWLRIEKKRASQRRSQQSNGQKLEGECVFYPSRYSLCIARRKCPVKTKSILSFVRPRRAPRSCALSFTTLKDRPLLLANCLLVPPGRVRRNQSLAGLWCSSASSSYSIGNHVRPTELGTTEVLPTNIGQFRV